MEALATTPIPLLPAPEWFASTPRLPDPGPGREWSQVAEPAQPFVAAALLRHHDARRVWIVCRDVRVQEQMHHDLRVWGVPSHFFPELEFSGFADALPDPDIAADRLAILSLMGRATDPAERLVVILGEESLGDAVPAPGSLQKEEIRLSPAERIDLPALLDRLEEAGYERVPQVFQRGQFALRGGILDIFSWQNPVPFRAELFDDEIESLREFDVDDQISTGRVPSATILLEASTGGGHVDLAAYLRPDDLVIGVECDARGRAHRTILSGGEPENAHLACFDNPLGAFAAGDFVLQEVRRTQFIRQMHDWHADGWHVAMVFNTEGERERFAELVDAGFLSGGLIQPVLGRLERGFTVPAASLAVLSDAEIFGRYQHLRTRRLSEKRLKQRRVTGESDLREYAEGDYVVHHEYGIGKFLGIQKRDGMEVIAIRYADDATLYVPVDQSHLVNRYVGVGKAKPDLDPLGGKRWNRTREKAEKSILDYAAHLLDTQAERTTSKPYAHTPDTKWQWEFENSFLFQETPDQLTAIAQVKEDMESGVPMDRLICGDVGFGKTEVAIRAAFKAVMSGRQVALLVPTTVLAQQHYQNFRERMSDYPVTIGLLSRYRTPAEQRKTLQAAAAGSVDILIGTHRLISKDVSFAKLGLVIIDEEQRFGVKHKERFKELFRKVDILTLSATPIPRTLYLSLMGVKDMSTIDTPPPNRIPVSTTICPYDERIIKQAIERELHRQGQVFFLHNRVQSILTFKEKLEKLVPGARIGVGHGQMDEGLLEDVMNRFVNHEFDVLVSTTIIESGVDIPNANTIIIDRADRFGLADLYQLRGRVGRSGTKAYAILLIPRDLITAGDARRRITAIKQYTALGSGFKIAMRDLEIRGAGNLLGTQQSGHIAAVGFDLYCRLLKQSIAKLKGERITRTVDVAINIDFLCTSESEFARAPQGKLPAFLPVGYMTDPKHRITGYRELAEVATLAELHTIARHWQDRFGRRPEETENLLRATELKLRCAHKQVSICEIKEDKLILTRNGRGIQIEGKYPRLESKTPKDRLLEALDLVKSL
ncbi:MAG: transcription-repair coupling factor [Verrucomicrobia bacterium]|nr:transcription-repair coupling factor [Verrucomicrobiota bacterium]